MSNSVTFQVPRDFGKFVLAPYACDKSRGRLHKEHYSGVRSLFEHDHDRITHSDAFRRMSGKTQVFVNIDRGDHYRTRRTHTDEVAQIAFSVARRLGLNPDLTRAVALAHDLGHPPFGHAGEEILRKMMEPFGGFDHNAHAIVIVTSLEKRYAAFDGLNLTWETLEGIAKHNGPVTNPPRALSTYNEKHNLELSTYPSLEAQIAGLCDDIAYNNHDLEDGLRSGILNKNSLNELPFLAEIFVSIEKKYPGLEKNCLINECKNVIIGEMVSDLIECTHENIAANKIQSADDARALGKPVAQFSPQMLEKISQIKKFLMKNMYRHERIMKRVKESQVVIEKLFEELMKSPEKLPTDWQKRAGQKRAAQTAETVCNYIAGMTDRYAHIKLQEVAG